MMKKLRMIIGIVSVALSLSAVPAFAQTASPTVSPSPTPSTSSTLTPTPDPEPTKEPETPGECGTTKTHLIGCTSDTGVGAIGDLIKLAISVLTVLIGVVATGGFAYAAVVYASARDDKVKVGEAIAIIRNTVIGLLLYGFTIVIINWLIPGGVIG